MDNKKKAFSQTNLLYLQKLRSTMVSQRIMWLWQQQWPQEIPETYSFVKDSLPIRWWLCNHLIPGVEMWVSKALDKLICCLRNEWASSFTTFACQEMEDRCEDFEFGLTCLCERHRLLTNPLLSCAYSTDGITICDCQ